MIWLALIVVVAFMVLAVLAWRIIQDGPGGGEGD